MAKLPETVAAFLQGRRFAVAGVSRDGNLPSNHILRKLRACGYDAVPVNPNTDDLAGERCYRDLASIPGTIDGLVIAAPPAVAADLVRQAAARNVRQIWFHRSFGDGSVSPEAVAECARLGIEPVVGGCPMMFCQPVDLAHRCMRWWLALSHRVPT